MTFDKSRMLKILMKDELQAQMKKRREELADFLKLNPNPKDFALGNSKRTVKIKKAGSLPQDHGVVYPSDGKLIYTSVGHSN